MKNRKVSEVRSVFYGSEEEDEQGVESEEPTEELSEEPSEDSASESSSDKEDDSTGQSRQKPDVEPIQEVFSKNHNGTEQSIPVFIEEEETEPSEEPFEEGPFEECESQPSPNTGYNEHCFEYAPNSSNEKKRPFDATEGDLRSFQAKKSKLERSVRPLSNVNFTVGNIRRNYKTSKESPDDGDAAEKQDQGGSSGKRRHSRWEPQLEGDAEGGEGDRTIKKRKTRWSTDESELRMLGPLQLPDFMNYVEVDDPEIRKLKTKLSKINKELSAEFNGDLFQERLDIFRKLIEKNPAFKAAPEEKPPMLSKKLYVPVKAYPGYNFIGLIIGPRGNTLKKMEKDSGATIKLRGKGAYKEGKNKKLEPFDKDELHVLIEADNQKSLDKAVGMVEKLLIPVAEGMNEHKRAQLRELAELKSLKCMTCGEEGHKQYACPRKNSTFGSQLSCDTCGGSSHSTASCPLTMSNPGGNLANDQGDFLGGVSGVLDFRTPLVSSSITLGGGNSGVGPLPSFSPYSHPGLGSTPTSDGKPGSEIDESNLYVGYLPQSVDENRLWELFSSFGRIMQAKVIKDPSGVSKGYGFVKYDTATDAAKAVARMNGAKVDGKFLAVRVKGLPATVSPSISALPKYPGPAALLRASPSQGTWAGPPASMLPAVASKDTPSPGTWAGPPGSMLPAVAFNDSSSPGTWPGPPGSMLPAVVSKGSPSQGAWPGPPGSMLPEPESASPSSMGLCLPPSSVFLGHSDSSQKHLPTSHGLQYHTPISLHSSLEQFPGHSSYPVSQYHSYSTTPPQNNLYQQLHPSRPLYSNLTESVHHSPGDTKYV